MPKATTRLTPTEGLVLSMHHTKGRLYYNAFRLAALTDLPEPEVSAALKSLTTKGLTREQNGRYALTPAGTQTAETFKGPPRATQEGQRKQLARTALKKAVGQATQEKPKQTGDTKATKAVKPQGRQTPASKVKAEPAAPVVELPPILPIQSLAPEAVKADPEPAPKKGKRVKKAAAAPANMSDAEAAMSGVWNS